MQATALALLATLLLGMAGATIPAHPKEAARVLSERELRQLFPGRYVAFAYGVARINLIAHPDGSVYGKMGRADTGVWGLQGKVLCIKFKRWLKGRKRCSTVRKKGDWYVTGPITFKKIGP
jgi:hypothetical protein